MFDSNVDLDDELETLLMSYDPDIIAAVHEATADIAKGNIRWDDDCDPEPAP